MDDILEIGSSRAALAIAHPGHELRVHGWLQRARPLVLVLTDGSGGRGVPRLATTRRILTEAFARPGSLFGSFPDREIYQAVLAVNTRLFLDIAADVAAELIQHRIELVVGDAAEGAVLTHDLWRGVVNRAVRLAEQALGRPIANYQFNLEGRGPLPDWSGPRVDAVCRLTPEELRQKIAAAQTYRELSREIEAIVAAEGEESLEREFFQIAASNSRGLFPTGVPHYETHGERQVSAGVYSQVVRFHQHVRPILHALQESTERCHPRCSLQEAA